MERLTVTAKEAAGMLGVGANSMYEIIHRPNFPAIRVGRRYIIPIEPLKRWIEATATSGNVE